MKIIEITIILVLISLYSCESSSGEVKETKIKEVYVEETNLDKLTFEEIIMDSVIINPKIVIAHNHNASSNEILGHLGKNLNLSLLDFHSQKIYAGKTKISKKVYDDYFEEYYDVTEISNNSKKTFDIGINLKKSKGKIKIIPQNEIKDQKILAHYEDKIYKTPKFENEIKNISEMSNEKILVTINNYKLFNRNLELIYIEFDSLSKFFPVLKIENKVYQLPHTSLHNFGVFEIGNLSFIYFSACDIDTDYCTDFVFEIKQDSIIVVDVINRGL
jgi:hypothetical protein